MEPSILLLIIIAITVFEFGLDLWLDFQNMSYMGKPLPEIVSTIYDKEKYEKSMLYQKETTRFGRISGGFSFILTLVLLYLGGYGWLDGYLRQFTQDPLVLGLAFFGVVFLVNEVIGIPFQWYSTFVLEEKFGFNKSTPAVFWMDKLKSYALTIVIGGLLGSVFFGLITWLGPGFWLVFWVVAALFMVGVNVFYTSLILPLFNKLKPLEDGSLKNAIQTYAQKVEFPLDNIFVIDGSKRSAKANAFFSGLGSKKKIVLYDTLIENHSDEELVAVLAHEVGHFKKNHILQSLSLSLLQMAVILYILSLFVFSPTLSMAMGGKVAAIHLNLLAFGILFTPISHGLGILMHIFSRKNEFEADAYAKETFGANPLIEALKKLSVNNLSNLNPHPSYVFFHYSHPPLHQRLSALMGAN